MYLTLVTVLCVFVAIAGIVVSVIHEPPTWAVVVGVVAGFALSAALLQTAAFADIAQSSVGSWSVRLASFAGVEALLTLTAVQRGRTAEN
ncbi:hypothetical protein ABZ490_07475 [Streptomyces sp. NPDC005811]|uniref:hypothetical protein n=1 Tax=Streptomyces sp. NPDC005811 TaxID=3154565 RepID=UPI0033DC4DCD